MFTSTDHEKFRALRVTHVATHFEQLLVDEANDGLTPEQLFLTAVDDALDARRANRVDKLIRAARFGDPERLRGRDRLRGRARHHRGADETLRRPRLER